MSDLEPRALIITGMHRSGTSLAASLLQSSGLHIGRRLLGPSPSNLRGHFENLDFVEFHRGFLRSRGFDESGWTVTEPVVFEEADAEEAHRLALANTVAPAWGWKDPRTVMFLRAWSAVLPDACFLFVLRSPWEVADSLFRRSSKYDQAFMDDPAFAVDVWARYNREIISFLGQHPKRCLLVSVHTLTRNAAGVVAAINRQLGLKLTEPDRERFDDQLLKMPPQNDHGFLLIKERRPDAVELYQTLLDRSFAPDEASDRHRSSGAEPPGDGKAWFRIWLDLRLAEKQAKLATAEGSQLQSELRQTKAELFRTQWNLDGTVHNATAERSRLQSELTKTQIELSRTQANLDETMANATAERSRLESELTKAQAEFSRTQANLDETMSNATAERSRLQSELTKTQAELSRTQANLDETMRNATAERVRLDSELTKAAAEQTRAVERLDETMRNATAERSRLLSELNSSHGDLSRTQQNLEQALRNATLERSRLQRELTATTSEADQRRAEIQILRAELKRSQYYLDETMNNAVRDRSRLDAELAAARVYIDLFEREGILNTVRRLRQKIRNKQRKLIRRYAPWLERAVERGRGRSTPAHVAMRQQGAERLSVDDFWQQVGPTLERYLALPSEPVRISVLTPTCESALIWFAETAKSVLAQSTTAWEWCIVDDGSTAADLRAVLAEITKKVPRIRVSLEPHGGISAATNRALAMATGETVCFLDHDDVLDPSALEEMLETMSGGCDVAYSDQDKIDRAGRPCEAPFHKPAWSPEYLRGVMYVGHLLAVRRELALRVGGFDSQFDGVQDFEFVLRLSEATSRIGHVAKILYHWRNIAGSIAGSPDAKPKIEELQSAAVNAHLRRMQFSAFAENGIGPHRLRIVPKPRSEYPQVSIIIPTRDAPGFLGRCLESIRDLTTYPNYELLLVDNDTRDPEALELMERFAAERIALPSPFNYSRANNLGSRHARGEYLLFLNNDTEVLTPDWIENLLYYAEQPDVGAVGGLLVYLDGSVQHAGIVLGMRGTADHVMRGFPATVDGYAGSLVCAREVSAVTGACMMLATQLFRKIDGFNEHFATHYQDVDLCLQLLSAGYRNIFTPRCVLRHFESVTRGTSYDLVDRMLLLDRWQHMIEDGDPFYNINFDIDRIDYSLQSRT